MALPEQAALLRIYTLERAKGDHRPLYELIVMKAREAGLAGVTVLRGPVGFGDSRHLHNAKIIDLSDNLPLVIEMVDAEAKLRDFAASLESLTELGLVTLEKVAVLHQTSAERADR